MGNDGGSIPKRRELVKEAAKALTCAQVKEAQNEQQAYGWTTDPLTRKPLATPVVSDAAGVLYNKDSIIEYLLKEDGPEKAEMGKVAGVVKALGSFGSRVKGLKDVVEIKFAMGSSSSSRGSEKWCNEPYAENDIIPILPTLPSDIARLSLRLQTLRDKHLTHALKKAPLATKKRKKTAAAQDSNMKNNKPSSDNKEKTANNKSQQPSSHNNAIQNASTASLTQKVMKEQEERNKRRKMAQNDNVKSLFSTKDGGGDGPDLNKSADYMTRGFSIGKK
ncbi:Replication termination factor 2 [Pleosporales sp. CAS-2024a]